MEHSVKQIEHEALIRGLGLQTDAATTQGLRAALAQVSDWDYLLKTALGHGVFPSLYRRVADSCPGAAPPEVWADWQRLYKIHARRNLRRVGELLKVLALLESQGIAAVSLKGLILAKMAYGDMALRQFYDLDLLVRHRDMPAVKKVLVSEGYGLLTNLTPSQERLHFRYDCELAFIQPKPSKSAELDVHWRFPDFRSGGLDAEIAFERKIHVSLEGRRVYSLTPADMLFFLCLHAGYHVWPKLSMVNDVARLLGSQGPWDWPGLLHYADSLGMRRRLLLGLSLATELLGASVPFEVAAMVRSDPVLADLHNSLKVNLRWQAPMEEKFTERNLFQIKVRERFRDKLVFTLAHAAVPHITDWSWAPLPDFLYWLYPIIRPVRLVSQYLIQPLGRNLLSTWRVMATSRLLVKLRGLGKPSKRR